MLSPASFLTFGKVNPGAFCETAQHAPQRMVRCTDGVGADCAWSSSQDRAVAISSGHSQNRAGQGVQQRQTGSGGAKRGSTPPQRPATVVREEDARGGPCGASTKVSRLQAALSSLGDGDMEEKRALELALCQGTETVRRIASGTSDITKEIIALLQTRKLVLLKLLCKMPGVKRITMCAKFFWQKHVSNAS